MMSEQAPLPTDEWPEGAPPPEDAPLPTHAGTFPAPDDDFFAPVPEEIGEPLTVHTTLRQGKEPMPIGKRMFIAIGVMLAAAGIGLFGVPRVIPGPPGEIAGFILVGGVALIALLGVLVNRSRRCTYVGMAGWSRHKMTGNDRAQIRNEIMRFADATALFHSEVRQYVNGVYSGTSYSFIWKDAQDRVVNKINGQYNSKQGTPKPKDGYWFARSTEAAWTQHWLAQHLQAIEGGGEVAFALKQNRVIRIGNGYLEFDWDGQTHRAELSQITDLGFDAGTLRMKFADKGIMKRGKLTLQVGEIPNFNAFTLALNRLLGFQFG